MSCSAINVNGSIVGVAASRRGPDDPHLSKPDLDKLQRALLDALKGVAFEDNAQVVHLEGWKHYTRASRLEVTIEPVETRPLLP